MCAVGRIRNGLKVVLCFMHATSFNYHHHADLLTCIKHIPWEILEACVNAYWVHSVERLSKMWLVIAVTFFIVFAINWVVCVKLARSRLSDREDIFITHLIIIIKSEVSAFPIVVIFPWSCAWGGCTIICSWFHIHPGKTGLCFFYYCAI